MSARDGTPKAIRRVDYRPPAFLVNALDLTFELDSEATQVAASFDFRRNPAAAPDAREAPLVLDGEGQRSVAIELDGVPLAEGLWVRDGHTLTIPSPPGAGRMTVRATINPAANVALE